MNPLDKLTPFGTAPNRNTQQPSEYIAAMNAWLANTKVVTDQQNTFIDRMNGEVLPAVEDAVDAAAQASAAAGAAAAATAYSATSTSTINTASASGQTLNLAQTGKGFAASVDAIVLIRRSDANCRAYGTFSAFNSGTGAGTVVLDPTKSKGAAGSYSDWLVVHAGLETVRPGLEADLKAFSVAAAVAL